MMKTEKSVTISDFLATQISESVLKISQSINKKEKTYPHFLMELDDIEPPGLLNLSKTFREKMEGLVDKSIEALESHKTWAGIMYDRLKVTEQNLTVKQVAHWEKCLNAYSKGIQCPKTAELLQYFLSHREDPNNSVIGITPSKETKQEIQKLDHSSSISKEELIERVTFVSKKKKR